MAEWFPSVLWSCSAFRLWSTATSLCLDPCFYLQQTATDILSELRIPGKLWANPNYVCWKLISDCESLRSYGLFLLLYHDCSHVLFLRFETENWTTKSKLWGLQSWRNSLDEFFSVWDWPPIHKKCSGSTRLGSTRKNVCFLCSGTDHFTHVQEHSSGKKNWFG